MYIKKTMKNALLSVGIFFVAIVLSILFQKLKVEEHITTVIVFAVFLISLLTDGCIYGIVSAVGGMLAVNYAFTMMLGRLEILPVLILFNKKTWKKF